VNFRSPRGYQWKACPGSACEQINMLWNGLEFDTRLPLFWLPYFFAHISNSK
jgi:hypothetical protein